uniref:Uncharacterized protein n=1 Tax=Avena sativa TaxID=4498 RepID=A0ACD5XQN3_AVESA
MSSRARGGVRRGRGRGRAVVAENCMDYHETSVPSSPSTISDREDNVEFTPEQGPVACYGPMEPASSTLLNPKINHRSDAIFGDKAVEQLKLRHHKPLKFHERYRPYLRDAGLLGLSQICQKMPQLDKALITALVERWRPETHSFHFASGEITVTLQDVAMLFALPIDGRPVCSTTDHDYGQMVVDCLGHDPRGLSMPGKSFLHYKWLKKHFYELPEGADDQTVQRHVRAYILSLLCGVLFPDGTGRMSLIYLPLIADLSLVGTYSWGSAALAFLYRALCSVSSSHNIKNIGGSLLLLQLWSWEHSHVGRPLARSSPSMVTDIPQDLPPIGFRWVGARAQSENATRCLKQYRDELNLQRADQLKWEPYMLIESSSLPPLCTKDADLWITQAPLINFPIVEMYLPERENHCSNNLLLGVEENYGSASLAIENCETADFVIPQHSEDVDQAGHPAEIDHSLLLMESMPLSEENHGIGSAPSSGPSSLALAATYDPSTQGVEPCFPQQSDDVKLEAEVKHTDLEENSYDGASSSNP